MNETRFGTALNPTTALLKTSPLTPCPEIETISDADLRNFISTGITVKIPTPFTKISTSALFGVNVDGFIPPYNIHSPREGTPTPIFMNLFPVQPTEDGLRLNLIIVQEMSQLPPIINFLSHRFISGNIKIAVRVSSNTALTGNFIVTQGSGMVRDFYTNGEGETNAVPYKGLRFLNSSDSGIDYAPGSFTNFDVSLNRNLSITPIRRDVTQKTDLARKFSFVSTTNIKENKAQVMDYNIQASQFVEDWLLFTPVSDFAGIAANQLSFTFYFDYSGCNFYTPMLAMMPFPPQTDSTDPANRREIFDFTATFKDKYSGLPISEYKFLRSTSSAKAITQEEKQRYLQEQRRREQIRQQQQQQQQRSNETF
jgi:hypothetical protein